MARSKMPTSVINRGLSLDRDRIKGFIAEHICGLIRIYNVCGVKDDRAWNLFYEIIFLDPVTTRHFSQYQLMWPHGRSRSSPFRVWWAAFRSYMGQMFDKTREQMNNWRWDNPRAFGDQVDRSNPETTSSGKVKRTGEHFSWYGSDDLKAKIEPPSCRQYKPGNFLAIRPLNWDEIIDKDDYDDNWADPGAPSGGSSRPAMAMKMTTATVRRTHRATRTGPGKGREQTMRRGKGRRLRTGRGKGRGRGRDMVKGKVLFNTPQEEMISLVPLLCSCRRKCQRQTWTQRAN
jgi:hypothetical protein